jgi:hypothetical protein
MHAMGSRLLGFSQELFDDSPGYGIQMPEATLQWLAEQYPNVGEMITAITHDAESVVGGGCDDQFEFEFALDLTLDGLERLRARSS